MPATWKEAGRLSEMQKERPSARLAKETEEVRTAPLAAGKCCCFFAGSCEVGARGAQQCRNLLVVWPLKISVSSATSQKWPEQTFTNGFGGRRNMVEVIYDCEHVESVCGRE